MPTIDTSRPGAARRTPLQGLAAQLPFVVQFVRTASFGSFVLLAAALTALTWANSPWSDGYFHLVHADLSVSLDGRSMSKSVQHWVNDGLMTLFFFVIGLEIKRELVTGRLRDRRAAALPALAALGGMAGPAVIYSMLNAGGPAAHGWAVPMATDIAFALGVLGLLGDRVPQHLRLFLLTLAIADDIGCILVIAFFYSSGISAGWLAGVAGIALLVVFMRWFGIESIWPYIVPGVLAWGCTLASGVHPTIAGVVVGVLTPAGPIGGRRVLEQLEHALHPWVAFLIVPLFALANAGVRLDWASLGDALGRQVSWGTAVGLVAGKTLGIGLATWLGLRLRVGVLPEGVRLRHVWALGPLAGVGFTVSLMIAALSFVDPARMDAAKVGILGGSVVGAALGCALLVLVGRKDGRTAA